MKKLAMFIVFIVLALSLTLCSAPIYANGIPPLPHAFYGTVKINGSPAPDDTRVSATVDEGTVLTTAQNPVLTVNGNYGIDGLHLLVQGDIQDGATITFYVNGVQVEGVTATFEAGGGPTEKNLSVIIAVPPAPPAVPGGGGGPAPPDTTPPRISNVLLCPEGVTETTADICWITDERGTSQAEYWTSPSILSPLDETLVTEHHVHLTSLTPCTTYHYKTMSMDRRGNLAVSDVYTFTTLGKAPATTFTSSDLSVSPGEVQIGETVNINARVTNTGSCPGSYEVTLKINGAVEATKDITLNAGASGEVTFTTAKDAAGSYSVAVNGLTGSFTVKEKAAPPPPPPAAPPPAPPVTPAPPALPPGINWAILGPIIAVVVFLAIFIPIRRRRAG